MTTKEDIQKSINSRLKSLPTQIEGGGAQDVIGSVAYELANIVDTKIDVILDNAFVTTADEEHLLIKGGELGIFKKEAQPAFVWAQITDAEPNILINSNVQAKTKDNIVFQVAIEGTTDENGSASIKMQCTEEGAIGNIQPNELTEFVETYTGLENAKITNEKQGYDGFDFETTEEYRQRILEYMQDNACNSNMADYKLWAKSVPGVKDVVVKDATTMGAGHVGVYISALNNEPVSDELIQNTKTKIEQEQIINAQVSVFALEYFKINISADVTLKEGYNISDIEIEFKNVLKEYLASNLDIVSYLYISNLFFELDGIKDISNYFLCEKTSSIILNSLQIPVVGEINFNVV